MRFPRLRQKIDAITKETYYIDLRLGKIQYRRLVGAIAWSYGFEKPGCVVLLGEGREFKQDTQNHWIYVVGEFSDFSSQELLRIVALFDEVVYGIEWVANLKDPHFLIAEEWNRQRAEERKKTISFISPPGIDKEKHLLFRFYDQIVDKRTRTQKSLFFGNDSIVSRQYAVLQHDDMSKPIEAFPCVCAFFYALATIELEKDTDLDKFVSYYEPADSVGGY